MVDAILQAHNPEANTLLGNLTQRPFQNGFLVDIDIKNQTRQFTGAPDTVFLDPVANTIALIEVKTSKKPAKITLDQVVKYFTLSELLRSPGFFVGADVEILLVSPKKSLKDNCSASEFRRMSPMLTRTGRYSFEPPEAALEKLRPGGIKSIEQLVAARLAAINPNIRAPRDAYSITADTGLRVISWAEFVAAAGPGELADDLSTLADKLF